MLRHDDKYTRYSDRPKLLGWRGSGEARLGSKKITGELNRKMIQEMGIHQDSEKLKRCIDRFSDARVVVVGDIIMDEYIWGNVSRISPEAPVPVVDIKEETKMLGGAANVLNNIASFGGRPILCGVIGGDQMGQEIVERVKSLGLRTDGIIAESHRPTSIKTRVVAHNQQVVRFDRESRKKLGPESIEKILDFIKKMQDNYDAILVADYGKGVISAELMEGLRGLVLKSNAILAVDPKIGNFECYQNVDVITPNHHEAGAFCRMEIIDQESLVRAGNQMLSELNCRSVLITRGKDGMSLFEDSGEISHIPTVARKVYDVTGAGDTVISTFCLGLAAGLDLKSAALISNFAAGIVVSELGTSTVKAEELKKAVNSRPK
jgi:D-beta-D-heptose 7-phosphate kinase/D-beta-D-heptose 1-phosphate adenosyltransferase